MLIFSAKGVPQPYWKFILCKKLAELGGAKKQYFLIQITVSADFVLARYGGTISSQPILFSRYLVKTIDWFDTGDW